MSDAFLILYGHSAVGAATMPICRSVSDQGLIRSRFCGSVASVDFVRVLLANPRFDVFANLDRQGSAVIGFALGDLSEIVMPADVPLLAQLVERWNELFLWINRKLEGLDGPALLVIASYYPVARGAQRRRGSSPNRIVGSAQVHVRR